MLSILRKVGKKTCFWDWTSSTVSYCDGKIELRPFEEFLCEEKNQLQKKFVEHFECSPTPLLGSRGPLRSSESEHLYLSTTKIWSNCSRLPHLFLWLCIHLYLLVSWQIPTTISKMTVGTPEVRSDQCLIWLTFDIWHLTFDI